MLKYWCRLQNLKETEPDFWKELTNIENQVPSENNPQPEDIVESEDGLVNDDSDMPFKLGVLIQEPKKVPKGFTISDMSAIVAENEAESLDGGVDGDKNGDKY